MANTEHGASIEINEEEIDQICEEFGNREGAVVQILQTIQEKYGYVPAEVLERVLYSRICGSNVSTNL